MEIQEIISIVDQAVYKALDRFYRKDRLYSINSIAKRLHVHHTTIKNLCKEGFIKTTLDGKFISEEAINEYLKNKYDQK